jgi:hypothetical protein
VAGSNGPPGTACYGPVAGPEPAAGERGTPPPASRDPSASHPGRPAPVTDRPAASRSAAGLRLRPAPAGMPEPDLAPPVVAEPGDPFATLRIVDLVARIERGVPVRLGDIVDGLNARHLDWLFDRAVVADALVALQANWMADYRNASGIVLEDGPDGATVTLEDSSRVDPWIARQAQRLAAACREALDEFARRGGVNRPG